MAWWNRTRKESTTATEGAPPESDVVMRMEGVSRVFRGDADEVTYGLRDATVDIKRGRSRSE